MRAMAGPAMMLVLAGGFLLYRTVGAPKAPSRDFVDLELAADDAEHSGTCYSLSTVLVANGIFGNAARTWSAPDPHRKDKWTLGLENVRQDYNGPVHEFQNFTFEKFGDAVRLVGVEASKGFPTDVTKNLDNLLSAPHARKSTPVDRCLKDGSAGYQYPPGR